jgi:PKD repeat protein
VLIGAHRYLTPSRTGSGVLKAIAALFAAGVAVVPLATADGQAGPAVQPSLPPSPDFTVSSPVVSQVNATFTSTSSASPGREIALVQWDFDNNGSVDAEGASVQHKFPKSGSATVRLRVVDNHGQAAEITRTITIQPGPPPTADFTWSNAVASKPITFTSTSTASTGRSIQSVEWYFGGQAVGPPDATGPSAVKTYPSSGLKFVRMRVKDDDEQWAEITKPVNVDPLPSPTLDYRVNPVPILVNQPATFEALATPQPGRTIATIEWDFGVDGTVDATGPKVQRGFSTPGLKSLRLRAVDDDGQVTQLTDHQILVNAPPEAAFTSFPAEPLAGQQVTLVSYSQDSDGLLKDQSWDLDADGAFDDAAGPLVTHAFPAGSHTVALRVTDQLGTPSTLSRTIAVRNPPSASPPTSPPASPPPAKRVAVRPPLLTPFPIVRLVGVASEAGVQVRLLAVRAPAGARVVVQCSHRACPRRSISTVAGASRLRFRPLERFLPAGAVLEIYVRATGRIGKYARFKIRRYRIPRRTDSCLWPGQARKAPCPKS